MYPNTPTIGLEKPELTDNYSLASINRNSDKIDAAFAKANQDFTKVDALTLQGATKDDLLSYSDVQALQWKATRTYPKNVIINYNGQLYLSAVANNKGNNPTTPGSTFWTPLNITPGGVDTANLVAYNRTASGLISNNIQDAVNELSQNIIDLGLTVIKGQTKKTIFNSDGSITEQIKDGTGTLLYYKNTVFNSDGSITETTYKGNVPTIKTTSFGSDGSITEIVT